MLEHKQIRTLMKSIFIPIVLTAILALAACQSSTTTDGNQLSTPTSGQITIAVDETLKPVIDAQLSVFAHDYPKADITPKFVPEGEAINMLLNDSVQLAIVCRELTDKEKAFLKTRDYKAIQTKSAKDGIALIVNPANTDTLLKYDKMMSILKGEITDWKQLNPKSKAGKIQLVFDLALSSTYRYITESTGVPNLETKNFYAVGNDEKVIEYVSKNKEAIGFIGSSWISDKNDSTALSFIQSVNVLGISPKPGADGQNEYFQPFQAYIAQDAYPFTRTIYAVCSEPRAGLATGFSSFMSGPKGQRIFLKSSVVPAKMPIRLIRVTK